MMPPITIMVASNKPRRLASAGVGGLVKDAGSIECYFKQRGQARLPNLRDFSVGWLSKA